MVLSQLSDFQRVRQEMVEVQLIRRGIGDPAVLAAMRKVVRHRFVPEHLWMLAYADQPLPIDRRQTISQPYIVALMTEALQLSKDDKVLEIGTGSGYQAAVLAELCSAVYTIETIPDLAKKATTVLQELGYGNIIIKIADGTRGWPEYQPYNGIIVTAGAPHVPQPLLDQLAEGGRLVIPVGDQELQQLLRLTRTPEGIVEDNLGGCRFVPLRGEYGWP
jgi:protein-L-isoaspartate(D-aspartate) O-methyltransferase